MQVWISSHFGVLSEQLHVADENLLFIGGTFYPTADLCKGNSSALWLSGVARAAPSWRRAPRDRGRPEFFSHSGWVGPERFWAGFRFGGAGKGRRISSSLLDLSLTRSARIEGPFRVDLCSAPGLL